MKNYHFNTGGFSGIVMYFRSRSSSKRILVGADEIASNIDGVLTLKSGIRFQIMSRPEKVERVVARSPYGYTLGSSDANTAGQA